MSADKYQRHCRAFGYTAPPFGCFDPDLPYSNHTHIDDGHKTQLAVRPTNRITVLCNRCKPNQNNVQSSYGVGPVVNIFQIKTLASLFNICLHLQITVLIFPSQSVLHFQFKGFFGSFCATAQQAVSSVSDAHVSIKVSPAAPFSFLSFSLVLRVGGGEVITHVGDYIGPLDYY